MMRFYDVVAQGRLDAFLTLYQEAFPPIERKELTQLLASHEAGKLHLLGIAWESEDLLGLCVLAQNGANILLDYFAIDPSFQGQQLGSLALGQLFTMYPGVNIVAEVEHSQMSHPDQRIRQRRKAFYLRNGFSEADFSVTISGEPFEVLAREPIQAKTYLDIYAQVYGKKELEKLSVSS
ncbi:hypothetical protein CL176_08250 [Suicoccus acidiformans]|uniref:N-acetyltransferase domain-containing protein n=2 Tax=Suicoccus acidiformans TaxID=2036206 RepID=A0A347WLN3_9LACT|nr:hypothetical protein CL176_08250 [Suicoccus acidiformans]